MGTMFSGCEIVHHVLEALSQELLSLYDLAIDVELCWLCEKNERKQKFLINQFKPDIVFRDAEEVVSKLSHNVLFKHPFLASRPPPFTHGTNLLLYGCSAAYGGGHFRAQDLGLRRGTENGCGSCSRQQQSRQSTGYQP